MYSLAQIVNFICDKTGLVLRAEFVILKNLALSSEPEAEPKLVDFVCKKRQPDLQCIQPIDKFNINLRRVNKCFS